MSALTETEKQILADFFLKRNLFDNYLKSNSLNLCTCPGCAYPTISERGNYEICSICNWEDDGSDDHKKSVIDSFLVENKIGGPNGALSLTQNRINIGRALRDHEKMLKGRINLDTSTVLKIIEFYNKKKQKIGNRMTGDENFQHPIWTEWKQIEKDLQIALINPEK